MIREDKKWVQDEIKAAMDALKVELNPPKPALWRQLIIRSQKLGFTGAVIVGLAVTIIIFALKEWSGWWEFRGTTNTEIKNIGEGLKEIKATLQSLAPYLIPFKIEKAASQPKSPENQQLVKALLTEAKQKEVLVPTRVVEQTGKSFIQAAEDDPKAWDVALDVLTYHSSRTIFQRSLYGIKPATEKVKLQFYVGPPVDNKPTPEFSVLIRHVFVAGSEAARYEPIGRNLNKDVGVPGIMMTGGAVNLDGEDIRHVIFNGVEIHYTGKPVKLENVTFVDCKFVIENTKPARKLSETILASADNVNFKTTT